MYISSHLGIPLGKQLLTKNKFSETVALMMTLTGVCLFSVSLVQKSIVLTSLYLGIVSPFIGMLYTLPFHCSSRYFPTYYNTLNAIFLGFQGLGAALFSLFMRVSANPHNLNLNDPFNKYHVAGGLRLVAICRLISAFFVWTHLKYNKGNCV